MTSTPGDLAAAWARALAGTSSVPMTSAETRAFLTHLASLADDGLAGHDSARKSGAAIGTALVETHHTQSDSLAATLTVLAEYAPAERDEPVLATLIAAIAAGYADALRERTRTEQEAIRTAVLNAYRTSEARFHAVFRTAQLGIGVADQQGRMLDVNERLAHMLGVTSSTVRGRDVRSFALPTDPPGYWEQYEALLAGRRSEMTGEKQFTRPDGEVVWARMQASTVAGGDGRTALMIALFEDITERRRMIERLHHQATHDPLTGLPNRTRILERLATVLRDPAETERVALCFLDLDGFKGVNDTLGHEAGDRLLAEISERLRRATAPGGHLVGRLGGDEFVVLLERTDGPGSVTGVADAILAAVRRPVNVGGRELSMTASIGIVERPAADTEPTELLRAADITLYWAKADGKDRWALFDPARNAGEVARYALSQALPAALERGELFVEYQPVVDLATRRVRAMEALVRWNHPERGLLGPGQFVPLAEETGTIVALGRWVLRRAAEDAAAWPLGPDGAAVAVAVNVAVRQMRDPGLLRDVHDALEGAGLPAERLHLEITESAVMGPGEAGRSALDSLQALADRGIKIAIDDFGTGYSNLAYLRRLPAHTLKIDSSFVAGLLPDAATGPDVTEEPIVSALITLAHAYGMTVTAEGVEGEEQAVRLQELGADTGQGFHFSRPIRAEKVLALLADGPFVL